MKTRINQNLIINGFGTASGGEFDSVTVNGKGTIKGDLVCQSYESNGGATVSGNIKAEKVKINGASKIHGSVETESISIDGHSSVSGDVLYENIAVSGNGSFGGSLRGEKTVIHGRASIKGDCETEEFVVEGLFTIGGLLNAEKINVLLYGDCKAKEIGGQTIHIKQQAFGLRKIVKSFFPVRLVTDVIEGDDIYIEGTKAKIVRGNNVAIGKNCEIELVEYKETIAVDKEAKIAKTIQS